jgi:lysophospholipase L1-like esterase
MAGTNDLLHVSPERTAAAVAHLLTAIRSHTTAPIFLVGIPPMRETQTRSVNVILSQTAGVVFVDPAPALSDDEGRLRQEFTVDGIHLNAAGYRAWGARLHDAIAAQQHQWQEQL